MKRCMVWVLLTLMLLSGCRRDTQLWDPVTFYYLRRDYQSDMLGVFGSEQWESTGHKQDLHYLLALYFMGPSRTDLVSPLPPDARIVSLEQSDDRISLTLTEVSLSESDFTLVCACLAQTLLGITDAQQITITCASRSITLRLEDLTLFDTLLPTEESI